jgi:uncharacterized membrane protein YadS
MPCFPPIPAMTAAVALGLLAANIPGTATWAAGRARPGLDFAGKHHMRAGIVLLGLKVSVVDVLNLGWFALVLIAAVVLLSFAGTYGLARLVKLPRDGALLIATGFSICGASAIGAMAAVRRIKHQDTVLPVAMVAVRSVGWLSPGVLDAAGGFQDILLASALFGLGSAVRVRTLLHTGGRAVLVALGSWFLIALLGLGAVLLMIR